MILSIGEILVDLIGNKNEFTINFQCFPGGAPFNVSCDIAALGGDVSFYGVVGNDLMGQFLLDFASQTKIKNIQIKKDAKHNTTLAFVSNDSNGERSFCFARFNSADYQFDINDFDYSLVDNANIVHIGSLLLSDKKATDFALKIIDYAHSKNKYVSFDVNFRGDIFKNETIAKKEYKKIIKKADIIKLSEDEIAIFSKNKDIKLALKEIVGENKLAFVSLGAKGSIMYNNGSIISCPSILVKPIDTTGAGDAFFAAILKQLDGKDIYKLSSEQVFDILQFANICGALTTEGKGAISAFPSIEKINGVLKNVIK